MNHYQRKRHGPTKKQTWRSLDFNSSELQFQKNALISVKVTASEPKNSELPKQGTSGRLRGCGRAQGLYPSKTPVCPKQCSQRWSTNRVGSKVCYLIVECSLRNAHLQRYLMEDIHASLPLQGRYQLRSHLVIVGPRLSQFYWRVLKLRMQFPFSPRCAMSDNSVKPPERKKEKERRTSKKKKCSVPVARKRSEALRMRIAALLLSKRLPSQQERVGRVFLAGRHCLGAALLSARYRMCSVCMRVQMSR